MLNFTVGPVMSDPDVLEVASYSTPYFRNDTFSKMMLDNEDKVLRLVNASEGSRCVFLTTSGTGAMESCVMNALNEEDNVIVINGGTFGQRFVDLCQLHNRKYTEIKCEFGKQITYQQLEECANGEYSALLVNMNETSSGLLYDMKLLSDFCKSNGIILIVDAISAFLADELDMSLLGADVVITGSQKALAVQPGISVVILSANAQKRIADNREVCMYLSLKQALLNMNRGQTPYTPAVTILQQINKRLSKIMEQGGIEEERRKIAEIANDFRDKIKTLPVEIVAENMSNAVTALRTIDRNAKEIVNILEKEYGIWVCPNGGQMADSVFRVGHIGYISKEDNQALVDALQEIYR